MHFLRRHSYDCQLTVVSCSITVQVPDLRVVTDEEQLELIGDGLPIINGVRDVGVGCQSRTHGLVGSSCLVNARAEVGHVKRMVLALW